MSEGFSFPILKPPEKEPLTARSTVVHATKKDDGSQPSTSKPALVAVRGSRNKVPLEKGYSQVDWLRLSRSGADLRGGQPLRKDIAMEEVRLHRTADDAWMVLGGKVYNITPYLNYHPGGRDILVKTAGTDGTAAFKKYHPWVNAPALLEACLLGTLAHGGSAGGLSLFGSGGGNRAAAAMPPPVLRQQQQQQPQQPQQETLLEAAPTAQSH